MARRRAARGRRGRAGQPGHAGCRGGAGRHAVDVAVPGLLELAERGVDRRGPAHRAGRQQFRLAALEPHVLRTPSLSSGEDWRAGRFNARAEDYNHDLVPVVRDGAVGRACREPGPGLGQRAERHADRPQALRQPARQRPAGCARPRGGTSPSGCGRPTGGRRAALRFAAGIEAAWRGDILEQAPGAPLTVRDGVALRAPGPVRDGDRAGPAGRDACRPAPTRPARWPAAGAPRSPAQPVYTRYWLHNKGPAPAGNVPVAVHLTPTRVTLRGDDGRPAGCG